MLIATGHRTEYPPPAKAVVHSLTKDLVNDSERVRTGGLPGELIPYGPIN